MKKLFLLCFCFLLVGCQNIYNKTMENVFGYEKRELLQKAVESVKTDQIQAQEQFQDAMTELKSLYGFDGGQLEKMYNKFKDEYDDCKDNAKSVNDRVNNMDRIAKSMFSEWSKEIKRYTNKEFAKDSQEKLTLTKRKYDGLVKAARKSEEAMEPILRKMNDHVLYLKHNLNAAAFGSLQGETNKIQSDVSELTKRMGESIQEANSFIQLLQ